MGQKARAPPKVLTPNSTKSQRPTHVTSSSCAGPETPLIHPAGRVLLSPSSRPVSPPCPAHSLTQRVVGHGVGMRTLPVVALLRLLGLGSRHDRSPVPRLLRRTHVEAEPWRTVMTQWGGRAQTTPPLKINFMSISQIWQSILEALGGMAPGTTRTSLDQQDQISQLRPIPRRFCLSGLG